MPLLSINLSLLEIAVLLAGAIVLGFAVYFFITSRRSLKETIEKTNQKVTLRPGFYNSPTSVPSSIQERIVTKEPQHPKKAQAKTYEESPPEYIPIKTKQTPKEESIDDLKQTIQQQQKLLNSFLKQVEEIENEGREELELQNKHLEKEIGNLEARLEKKQAELEEVKQQASMAERMADKIEEVYQEFELLQSKMASLEKQANRANNLALELEDTRQSYEQVHKDLQRKTEKLEETYTENQRLQQLMNTMEDKLAEANLQRQQLHKKVQFLQDLNTDLQTVSDTNKKLQTELRRIGELESMLDMIAEERDYLLRKGSGK
jgi:chromosome segregation ATPase